MGFWVLVMLSSFAFGGTAAFIASNKNRDSFGWFCLGFLFSIFALVAICAVPALAGDIAGLSGEDDETPQDRSRPWLRG